MAYILSDQQLDASNVSSTTMTESAGTITDVTDKEKIYTRSIMDKYEFTFTASISPKVLTINLTDPITASGIAIMGLKEGSEIQSVKFNQTSPASTLRTCTQIATQTRTVGGIVVEDFLLTTGSPLTVALADQIEISWTNSDTGTAYISAVMVGNDLYEFDIQPKSLSYGFESIGKKTRGEGGQVYGSHTGAFKTCKFTTVPKHSTYYNEVLSGINYADGEEMQLVFVPNPSDNLIFYGSQKKCFSIKNLQGRQNNDSDESKWLQEATFDLEEEF